jgi:tetratricopeptide (TPR) repeat protein
LARRHRDHRRESAGKGQERRYESAEQLGADIRHYLDDEPIMARPASTLYQLQKFAKRNKALVTGVVAAFAALAVGFIVSTVQYRQAESQRRAADDARRESDTVTDFLANMLRSVNPGELGLALETNLRERIARQSAADAALEGLNLTDVAQQLLHEEILGPAGATVEEGLGDQPIIAARLHHALGAVYFDLGIFDPAEEHHRRAATLYTRERGADDPDALHNLADVAMIYRKSSRYEEAEELLREDLGGSPPNAR